MVYGHTPFQKVVKQFAKLLAIINPEYEIKFPDIQDKKLLDVMKVSIDTQFSDIWDPVLKKEFDFVNVCIW